MPSVREQPKCRSYVVVGAGRVVTELGVPRLTRPTDDFSGQHSNEANAVDVPRFAATID